MQAINITTDDVRNLSPYMTSVYLLDYPRTLKHKDLPRAGSLIEVSSLHHTFRDMTESVSGTFLGMYVYSQASKPTPMVIVLLQTHAGLVALELYRLHSFRTVSAL